jgi:uncharacterized coiled-coil DUF342 family protein
VSDHDLALHLQAQCEALRAELREVSTARDALLLIVRDLRQERDEFRDEAALLRAALEDAKRTMSVVEAELRRLAAR